MTRPVFLAGDLGGLRPGTAHTLTGEEARHAVSVRRVRVGEEVDLVDGAGTRATAVVARTEKQALTVDVRVVDHEPPPAVRLVLVQALAKGGRDEQAVEAATELGVDAVVPWQADRSVSVWAGPKADRGRQRWVALTQAAAKQSRRARVPAVHEPLTSRALPAAVASAVAAGGAALVLHEQAAEPIARAALPAPGTVVAGPDGATRPTDVVVVVGPEGGISDAELTSLRAAGAQIVRLGPHVLRTSTAGPVALAVLGQRLGRWG